MQSPGDVRQFHDESFLMPQMHYNGGEGLSVMDPIECLLNGEIEMLAVTCYENERPLHGLAGRLDWRLRGLFTRFVRSGIISGVTGETVLIPIRRGERPARILLCGAGSIHEPGARVRAPKETLVSLVKAVKSLAPLSVALSRADFGLNEGESVSGAQSTQWSIL